MNAIIEATFLSEKELNASYEGNQQRFDRKYQYVFG
jgi:hypothetical protein